MEARNKVDKKDTNITDSIDPSYNKELQNEISEEYDQEKDHMPVEYKFVQGELEAPVKSELEVDEAINKNSGEQISSNIGIEGNIIKNNDKMKVPGSLESPVLSDNEIDKKEEIDINSIKN